MVGDEEEFAKGVLQWVKNGITREEEIFQVKNIWDCVRHQKDRDGTNNCGLLVVTKGNFLKILGRLFSLQ